MSEDLSPEEQAFFDTRGETAPKQEEQPAQQTQTDDAPVVGDPPAAEEGQARDASGKFVPHAVFHAEREERKKANARFEEANSRIEELTKTQAVLNDRWNTLLQVNKEPDKPAVPDPETDIFGYMKYQGEQIQALKAQTQQQKQQEEQQRQYQAQQTEIQTTWARSAQAFAAKEPAFGEAAQFLSDARMRQLEALGMIDPNMATEQGRLAQINAETFQIVQASKQAGKDPAEVIFEMAKKYGYAPTAGGAAPDPNAAVNQKLDNLAKAINSNKTLAATNGASSADPDTAEAVAKMSDAEFSAWYAKNPGKFQKMMGSQQ